LGRGAGSPSSTMWPGLRSEAYFRAKCHLEPSNRLITIDMGRKLRETLPPFWGEGGGSPSNTIAWAKAYLHIKWHLNPSSRLATTDIGRKLVGCAPLREGELGTHLTQCGQGRGLPACQVSSRSIQPFGHNTPALQTGQDRTDDGLIAYGEPFYERSPQNRTTQKNFYTLLFTPLPIMLSLL